MNHKRPDFHLLPIGVVPCTRAAVIGRVGPPDPHLDVRWQRSMTFYGKRFDAYAHEDPHWVLRRRIAAAPLTRNLKQLERDDQYALTGSYYAIFRAILASTHGLPVVLLAPSRDCAASLPVLLMNPRSPRLSRALGDLLRQLLERDAAPRVPESPVRVDGIEVDELSAADVAHYFGWQ